MRHLPFAVLLMLLPAVVQAQSDSVTVVAGERYAASGLHRTVFGHGYRDLWTLPIRVPVLDPDTFAGGLEPSELGGGAQTVSLRFMAADGREFVFRSVDKNQGGGLHPDLQNTLVDRVAQDQVSTKHPGAAPVVARILEAAGVLHVAPTLAVMADVPALGAYRDQFAGMLGMMEERPDERARVGPFATYERVIGTERLLERLSESPEDRVQADEYLRARLVDFLVGDWDRHPDQWRWAQLDRDGRRYWLAIPRDRDNAFSRVDGVIGAAAGAIRPNITRFEEEYSAVYPLLHNAQPLDRRILPEVDAETWQTVAAEVQARVTDEVIAEAVARMPSAYVTANGEELRRALQVRRDSLLSVSREFYLAITTNAEVYGTDLRDFATAERLPDGSVEVTLSDSSGQPYFQRRYEAEATEELRIYLQAGDDEATIRGGGPAVVQIRVVGGRGDDVLTDASAGESVFFYDSQGSNRVAGAAMTRLDRHDYAEPDAANIAEANAPPARTWGSERSMFSPAARWLSEIGPVIGGGPTWTQYGFRRFPYASSSSVSLLWAPLETRFGIEADSRYIATGGRQETQVHARATQLSVTRFYGYGNESVLAGGVSDHRVWAEELAVRADLIRHLGSGWLAGVGVQASQLAPAPVDGFPSQFVGLPGTESFGVAGMRVFTGLDSRDTHLYPRAGLQLGAGVDGYPFYWGDSPDGFGKAHLVGHGYLPVPLPLESTLAVRLGGEILQGDAPLQHLVYLGGSRLRGYRTQRFAGDASAFGSAELRTRLGRMHLVVAKAEVGTIALADVGRVWWDGESAGNWHRGFGGGLWAATLERELTGHVVYAYGESHTFSAGIGMPF